MCLELALECSSHPCFTYFLIQSQSGIALLDLSAKFGTRDHSISLTCVIRDVALEWFASVGLKF